MAQIVIPRQLPRASLQPLSYRQVIGGRMTPNETTLAYLWQEQVLTTDLRTTEGRRLRVIYRGVWTHRRGPDFANALLDLDGELVSGDVELHVRASDWYAHGHHEDPAYDHVVLHAVWDDDLQKTVRRRDGTPVPTLELARFLATTPDQLPSVSLRPLGALGFAHCAPEIAAAHPELLHHLFENAGDSRLREKVARIQARLSGESPAQTLFWLLADALGYHQNRQGMRAIAEELPLMHLEVRLSALAPEKRFPMAAALLLGTAGFLPLSDAERELVKLPTRLWQEIEAIWNAREMQVGSARTLWRLGGVRPTNHPVRRLLNLAGLLATTDSGLLADVLERLVTARPRRQLFAWLRAGPVPLGQDRAHDIIVNVIIPFALGYADWIADDRIREAAAQLWLELPAGRGNQLVRATLEQVCGPTPIRLRSARAEQGLLHLYHWGCRERRCWECPVAHLVLSRSSSPSA